MFHTINGLRYHLEQQGSGKRQALFLHYFGGAGSSWSEVVAQLPEIACFAPDLAGFGTTAPIEGYTVDQHARDMLDLAEALDLDDFALVGHSMGGKIAMALAALRPAGLRELILVAPSPPSPEPISTADRQRLLKAFGDRKAITEQLNAITAATLPANLLEQAINEHLQISEIAWRGWLRNSIDEDITSELAKINVPVTILLGEADSAMTSDLISSTLTPFLTNTTARISVIPNAGHLLPFETPHAIAQAVLDERRAAT